MTNWKIAGFICLVIAITLFFLNTPLLLRSLAEIGQGNNDGNSMSLFIMAITGVVAALLLLILGIYFIRKKKKVEQKPFVLKFESKEEESQNNSSNE